MSKMASHEPFGHPQHKLCAKEGSGVKLDSRPLKVGNRPDLLAFRRRATYRWKALDEGSNFALDLIAIRGLQKKLCALKVAGVLGQKAIWMWPPWRGVEYTIWWKVVAPPSPGRGESSESIVAHGLSLALRVLQNVY